MGGTLLKNGDLGPVGGCDGYAFGSVTTPSTLKITTVTIDNYLTLHCMTVVFSQAIEISVLNIII